MSNFASGPHCALSLVIQSSRYLTYSIEAWVQVSVSAGVRGYRGGTIRTCKIANLCISPVHAGIKLLRTANSSFIFDLRRRSIRLWAVFLAIFLPAALVADGCFLLVPATAAVPEVLLEPAFELEAEAPAPAPVSSRGCIWMIFRERVGGGGRANWSLGGPLAVDERRRDLTVSLGCVGYVVGGVIGSPLGELDVIAGGGSSKDSCSEAILVPS